MCIALVGKIIERDEYKAKVDFNGIVKDINIMMIPDAELGDHIVVHAGIGIRIIDKDDMSIYEVASRYE